MLTASPADVRAELARMAGNNALVIASVSGGRDSGAASLWLTENGIGHERVFADTGWEHALTYEYLRGTLTRALGPIAEVRGKYTMQEWILRKGMFPSRTRRFCTVELKVKPLKAHIARRAAETGRPVVSVIGIRRAESKARTFALEWDGERYDDGTFVTIWRPLVNWTAEDVAAIHRRHGLPMNPLYALGAARVGCWPCINARKAELRLLGRTDPSRVAEIAELEAAAHAKAAARYAARGETFESLGYLRPTFFMQVGPKSEREHGVSWPIDRVMAWARTGRGGRQFTMDDELFAAPSGDEGCVRWGLCEMPEVTPC